MSAGGATPISATVVGIEPVDGWVLWATSDQDGEGFWSEDYFARSATRDRYLHVSRFDFTPTQERFAFLVRNGFPSFVVGSGGRAPWCNETLDAAIERADNRAQQARAA